MAWDRLWNNNSKAGSFCVYCEVCRSGTERNSMALKGCIKVLLRHSRQELQEGRSPWCDGTVTGYILADLRDGGDKGPQKPRQAGFVHPDFDF